MGQRSGPAANPQIAQPTASQQPVRPTAIADSTVDGVPFISLAALDDRVIGHRPALLLFTAPGCASCAAEARSLKRSLGSHPRVQLVGVDMSQDAPGDLAKYLKFIDVADSAFIWIVDTDSTITTRYQVSALSSSVGIDGSGKVQFLNQGPADQAQLLRQIAALG
jgi:hypothetical protein